jgi:hypothetical protein
MQLFKFLLACCILVLAGFCTAEARTRGTGGWIGLASLSWIAALIALLWLADRHDDKGGRASANRHR